MAHTQLKDLRSQITREACVTLSYLCVVLGQVIAPFAASMLPQLFALLPNSAKVMAISAEICVRFIVKVNPQNSCLYTSTYGFFLCYSIRPHRKCLITSHHTE